MKSKNLVVKKIENEMKVKDIFANPIFKSFKKLEEKK